jgi:hypothetical protein
MFTPFISYRDTFDITVLYTSDQVHAGPQRQRGGRVGPRIAPHNPKESIKDRKSLTSAEITDRRVSSGKKWRRKLSSCGETTI